MFCDLSMTARGRERLGVLPSPTYEVVEAAPVGWMEFGGDWIGRSAGGWRFQISSSPVGHWLEAWRYERQAVPTVCETVERAKELAERREVYFP